MAGEFPSGGERLPEQTLTVPRVIRGKHFYRGPGPPATDWLYRYSASYPFPLAPLYGNVGPLALAERPDYPVVEPLFWQLLERPTATREAFMLNTSPVFGVVALSMMRLKENRGGGTAFARDFTQVEVACLRDGKRIAQLLRAGYAMYPHLYRGEIVSFDHPDQNIDKIDPLRFTVSDAQDSVVGGRTAHFWSERSLATMEYLPFFAYVYALLRTGRHVFVPAVYPGRSAPLDVNEKILMTQAWQQLLLTEDAADQLMPWVSDVVVDADSLVKGYYKLIFYHPEDYRVFKHLYFDRRKFEVIPADTLSASAKWDKFRQGVMEIPAYQKLVTTIGELFLRGKPWRESYAVWQRQRS